MRVVLIRHGHTDWNEEGVFRGRIDIGLNKKGRRQADIIGRRLRNVHLDAVYSSPLSRAVETAQRIASHHGMEVQLCEELVDIDFGRWQGMKLEDVRKQYTDVYRLWETAPHRVRIPEAETFDDVRIRLLTGLNEILRLHADGTVALVSHGLTNKVLICAVLGLGNSHFWKVKQDNGAINLFKFTENGSKLFLMNDTSHLYAIEEIVEGMKYIENPLG